MSKTAKILLLLTFIALLLVFYLIMSSQIITVKPDEANPALLKDEQVAPKAPKVDLLQLEESYKEKIKPIFKEFEQLLSDFWTISYTTPFSELIDHDDTSSTSSVVKVEENEVLERISELKIGLMDLTVPEQYRDLHLGLVLCFSKIKNSIENKSETDKNDGLALIRQAKSEYSWLVQ